METNFEDILRNNQPRIYRLVYSFLKNEHDTDEVVQNTFINAYRGFKNFRADSSVATWLTKIAVNNVRSYCRKRKLLSLFYIFDGEEKAAEIKDIRQNTEKEAENNIISRKVNKAIAALPARQKEVFIMKHLNGMSIAEIENILGISEGGVKSNIFKAVQNLRKSLEGINEM